MNSATNKVDDLLEQLMCCDFKTDIGIDKAKTLIRSSLKAQDKETSQMCAKAVLECDEDMSGECIWKHDAYTACMNITTIK